jgi:uncharacterized protein YhbP (UPF0306 family)
MTDDRELVARTREMIDASLYMTLATADEAGRPWVSPVYFAVEGYREFFWVSNPESRHSRNLAVRPELAIVIFDSKVPISTGQGVYLSAVAEQLTGTDRERGIEIFSDRSLHHGGEEWTLAGIDPPAELRLYRAVASECSVNLGGSVRIPVDVTRA